MPKSKVILITDVNIFAESRRSKNIEVDCLRVLRRLPITVIRLFSFLKLPVRIAREPGSVDSLVFSLRRNLCEASVIFAHGAPV